MSESIEITPSSGNVYADLALPGADELLVKSRLAHIVGKAAKADGMNQSRVAALVGESQPNINAICRGRLANFSLERLLNIVARLGYGVRIVIDGEARAPQPVQVEAPSSIRGPYQQASA